MLTHELLRDEGILILRPQGPLQAGDFTSLARLLIRILRNMANYAGLWSTRSLFRVGLVCRAGLPP